MAKTQLIPIGSFELTTPRMLVTDPCYEPDTFGMGELNNCITGTWDAYIRLSDEGEWGKRVATIIVKARDTEGAPSMGNIRRNMRFLPSGFKELRGCIGVDSGQAGFFDAQNYQRNDSVDGVATTFPFDERWGDMSPWYKTCCDRTFSEEQAGVIPFGAVSSSGYGDGAYTCGYHENLDGKADMAFITFI